MGKKRKLEVNDHDAYEEDRAPAEYSNSHKQQAGGSRVEAEIVSYLQEVSQHFCSLRDAEERELLLANVLDEIQGKEGRIASDAVTSRLLEQLLVEAPASQLMRFMQAFTNEDLMFSLAGSAFGSHVAEKVLAGLHHQADQLDDAMSQQLEKLLAGMVGAIGSNLYDYIMDKHATHVARALLVVIAGQDVLSPVAKKKHQQQQQPEVADEGSDQQQAAATAAAFNAPAFKSNKSSLQEKLCGSSSSSSDHFVRYPGLLRRYAKMLPCYDASNMSMLGKNSYSSPFIQAVLRAAAADSELLLLLLPPILGVDSSKAAAAPGQVLGSLTDSHVGRLLRDDCYSHLLEVVMTVMPQSLADEFYTRFLKGRLVPLTNHHSANFVIQAWLATMKDSTQVGPVLSELSPHLCDLLKRRRSGVVAALMAAAGRAGAAAQQQAAAAALAAALSQLPQWQGREGTDHLAPALLTLDTNTTMGGSSSSNGQQQQHRGTSADGRLSTPGSAILATILTLYNKKAAKPFVTSVISLNPVDAGRTARDPAGSRALQALIEGSAAGSEAKSQLLSRLSGSWCDIALQAAGSFFLEKAYAWASESEKEVVVSELASRSSLLMSGCPWGPMLARKLGLEAYQRSPDEWRKRAAAAAKAFEQMLSHDMPVQGNKRKRQQQQQDEDVPAAAAAAAPPPPDGSSGKERKKRRREAGATTPVEGDHSQQAAAKGDQAAAAVNGTKKKNKKRSKHDEDPGAGDDAVTAEAAVDKPRMKKHKAEHSNTAAGVQDTKSEKKKKKRKRHSSPSAAATAAAGGGGSSTDEILTLLGFGGLGAAGTGAESSKKQKTK